MFANSFEVDVATFRGKPTTNIDLTINEADSETEVEKINIDDVNGDGWGPAAGYKGVNRPLVNLTISIE